MDGEFIYILSDTTPFPAVPDWFKKFTNTLVRAKFWLESNNDDTLWNDTIKDIQQYRERRFQQQRAQTRLV